MKKILRQVKPQYSRFRFHKGQNLETVFPSGMVELALIRLKLLVALRNTPEK